MRHTSQEVLIIVVVEAEAVPGGRFFQESQPAMKNFFGFGNCRMIPCIFHSSMIHDFWVNTFRQNRRRAGEGAAQHASAALLRARLPHALPPRAPRERPPMMASILFVTWRTLDGPFSAVSRPTIARLDAFFSIFQNLHVVRSFAPLETQFFAKKIVSFFCKFCYSSL